MKLAWRSLKRDFNIGIIKSSILYKEETSVAFFHKQLIDKSFSCYLHFNIFSNYKILYFNRW